MTDKNGWVERGDQRMTSDIELWESLLDVVTYGGTEIYGVRGKNLRWRVVAKYRPHKEKPATRPEALDWLVANIDEWPEGGGKGYSSIKGWCWHLLRSDNNGEWKLFFDGMPNNNCFSISQSDWLAAQSKSDSPGWGGEGLPPVGTECEFHWGDDDWEIGHIEYLSEQTVVITLTDGAENSYTTGEVKFRPLKSEAERSRETAIDELSDLIESSDADGYNYGGLAAVIYDAGWRKLEDGHDSNG